MAPGGVERRYMEGGFRQAHGGTPAKIINGPSGPPQPWLLALALLREPPSAVLAGARRRGLGAGFSSSESESESEERTAARLASSAAIRSGAAVGSSACGWTATSSPAALASISFSTC